MTSAIALRAGRAAAVLLALWAALTLTLPSAMDRYGPWSISTGAGFGCAPQVGAAGAIRVTGQCGRPLEEVYATPLANVIVDATARSLVLLAGAALLAFVVGTIVGAIAASWRRHALRGGALLGATSLFAAIPAFFIAYFLQILVIILGGATGRRILPIFGFGYDDHIVLPLLAVAVPAVMTTAQLASARFAELLDEEFVTTARAKGLLGSWIIRVHVLPHALPVILEGVGNGLRLSVASLPIVEYLFVWNGIGFIALQSIASRDAAGLTASALVLAALFALLAVVADLVRPPTR
ncbi:MAG TPA: ABC transporter permease subunit [Candidatus Limnocylindria bacterium]|jgi:peptide/nickel transport system permease protein